MSMGGKFNKANYKEYFRTQEYLKLSRDEREDLIKFAVEETRKEKGLAPIEVTFERMSPKHRGATWSDYSKEDGQVISHHIKLNEDVLTSPSEFTSYSVYQTINHEARHDYQHEISANQEIDNSDPYVLEQRLNQQHYYRYGGDKTVSTLFGKRLEKRFGENVDSQLYYAEAIEKDAREAGLKAIEDLQKDVLTNDPFLDAFIYRTKQIEESTTHDILETLGMHSREEIAREELRYVPEGKLTQNDRENVLAYARQKDYESYENYIEGIPGLHISKEQIKKEFEEDFRYDNFFKSESYQKNKAVGVERRESDLSHYKWDESGEEFLHGHAPSYTDTGNLDDEAFLSNHAGKSSTIENVADESFFNNVGEGECFEEKTGEMQTHTENQSQII